MLRSKMRIGMQVKISVNGGMSVGTIEQKSKAKIVVGVQFPWGTQRFKRYPNEVYSVVGNRRS